MNNNIYYILDSNTKGDGRLGEWGRLRKKYSKIIHMSNISTSITTKRIRNELTNLSDPQIKKSGERFFKESVNIYGVKTAMVGKLARDYFKKLKGNTKEEIFQVCEQLWKSGYMEESFIACHFSNMLHKSYEEKDLFTFEHWVKQYIGNWASCDTFCNHTMGTFVMKFPKYVVQLKKWAKSNNRWVRRASAVSLIIPARKGLFLHDIFEIADILLMDKDDMVQKGYGWMLKAASQAHEKEVFDYVMKRKTTMPRTALRYAIEKMSVSLKKQAMQK